MKQKELREWRDEIRILEGIAIAFGLQVLYDGLGFYLGQALKFWLGMLMYGIFLIGLAFLMWKGKRKKS